MLLASAESALSATARAAGSVRAVAGNTPILLDDPKRCFVILEGTVEIFLTEIREGAAIGRRQHLFSLAAGDLLFGVDGSLSLHPVALLAVGSVETAVVEMPTAGVASMAGDPTLREALAASVDHWVTGLSDGMARLVLPRPRNDATIAPGESTEIAANRRLGTVRGVAWLACPGQPPLYLDSEDAAETVDGTLLPICPASWLSMHETRLVRAWDTAAVVADGRCWPALAALHRIALDVLPMNLRLAAVDEVNRLRSRTEADRHAAQQALDRLAEPLARSSARRTGTAIENHSPLVRACGVVAEALGVAFQAPPRRRGHDEAAETSLDAIVRANRLRTRGVRLEDGWWRHDAGPFLLFREPGGQPLAVVPRGLRRRYVLVDPADGSETPLSDAAARALHGEAVSFYAPLPSHPLRGLDIGGNAFRFAVDDVLVLLALAVVGGLLAMGVPIGTGYLVDTVIPAYDLPGLLEMGGVLLVAAAALLVVRYAVQIAAIRIEGRAGARIQAAVIDRVLRLPSGFFKRFTAGDLTKRALAIRAIEQAVSGTLIGSLLNSVFALVSLGLMFWYSGRLALLALGLIALYSVMMVVLGLARVRRERHAIALAGQGTSLLLQFASGISKLRLAAAEDRAFLRWARLQGQLVRQRFQAEQIVNLANTIGGAYPPLANATLFAVVWYFDLAGDGRGAGDGLALGTLLAFLSAYGQSLAGIVGLASVAVPLAALQPLYAYARPILEEVPEADEAKHDPGTLTGAMELGHVSFRYEREGAAVLRDVSLSVAAGEYVALVGPSGGGKSTVLRLLLGLEVPDAGAILYDGLDLRGLDVQAVRRQLGVVMQNGRLMPGNLFENIIGANLHLTESDAWEAAECVGLANDIKAMPMGMQTIITDAGGALSGGQTQRILLARAIAARPRILMLDEATSALDNRTQAVVTDSLDRMTATRIVVAHRLSTVVRADRIVVLRDGRIEESGRYDALVAADGYFARFARRQLL